MDLQKHFRPSAVLVAILFLCFSTQAQEWEEVNMATSVSVNDLCYLDDGVHGWAVGAVGATGSLIPVIMRTLDGGDSWESELLPYPYTPKAVCFVSPERGWIGCSSGRIYYSDDGGLTWEAQNSGVDRTLSAISFIDESEGWMTGGWHDGSDYLVLHTSNGGDTWENQSFGSTCYSGDDIEFTDDLHGWICGYDSAINGHIHHTDDGGVTWTRQDIPESLGQVASISFAGNSIGWATTSSVYADPAGAILHTENGGGTWEIQDYTYLDYNDAVDARDDQHVAISSSQVLSPQRQRLVTTSDGGDTWVSFDVPMLSYSSAIQYVNDRIRLTGDESRILRTEDLGATWVIEHHAPWWQSIGWRDAATGWAVTVDFGGTAGYAWRTVDGGASWQGDPNAPGGSQALFVDEDHGWMLMSGNNAPIWRTVDGGDNWTEHSIGSGQWTEKVFFINKNRGWACGSGGMIRRTDDGGQTWSAQSSGTGDYVAVIFFIDEEEGWAAGGYAGGYGFIRHTVNGGDTWDYQAPASSGHHQTGFFLNSEEGWLIDYSGNVHHTTNGGDNWQIIGSLDHDYINELYMSDALTGWLTVGNSAGGGSNGLGYIYRTEDGGVTWMLEWTTPWPRGWVGDISVQPGGALWVCGAHSTLLVKGPPADVPPDSPGFADASNRVVFHAPQPNPIKDVAQLRYELPSAGRVRCDVYDVRGRRMKALLDEYQTAGSHTLVWRGDGSSGLRLPAGVYFARLESPSGVRTRQVLVR
jgi:photosystem II stability/assembly factor-like uncharacterized protein